MIMFAKIRGLASGLVPPSGWCWCPAVASLIMANTQHTQGPGQRVFSIGQRIVTLLAEMVETRLRLVVVELEEEKANLFQLLIMTGLTLLFAAFGLMSLLVLVIWAVRRPVPPARHDRHHRRSAPRRRDRGYPYPT